MKAFVIKNKEGKYCTGEFNENDEYVFTENLIDAEKFYEDIFAQRFCPKDCEVVEITIVEGGLEQENKQVEKIEREKELDNIFWKQECDSLQKALAEKEDFIKTLGFKNEDKFREYVLNCLLNKEDKVNRIRELEQQLAEKDKEIKMYNNFFKAFACDNFDEYRDFIGTFMLTPHEEQTLIRELKNNQKSIRRQVCEEVREKIKNFIYVGKSLYDI